jgi:CBS domain-containing protein
MTGCSCGSTIVRVTNQLSVPFGKALVSDVMTPGVINCPPETPLRTVARMMATYRVHAVVVFDGGDWSIVSDLDLVASASAADDLTAGAVSASPLVTVAPNETLERAAQLMAEHESAHLVVREPGADRPVGIVSTLDVARALAVEELLREFGFAGR